jgi:hypothetical protein
MTNTFLGGDGGGELQTTTVPVTTTTVPVTTTINNKPTIKSIINQIKQNANLKWVYRYNIFDQVLFYILPLLITWLIPKWPLFSYFSFDVSRNYVIINILIITGLHFYQNKITDPRLQYNYFPDVIYSTDEVIENTYDSGLNKFNYYSSEVDDLKNDVKDDFENDMNNP